MRALLRQSRCCLRANPSALPGLERFAVPTRPLLRVPVLLRGDDGGTGAVQRHHLRGHDGPCPANRAARNRRLGGMVHHRGCRGVSPHAGTRLAIRLPEPGLWSWPDAARLRRAAAAALSVGVQILRRHLRMLVGLRRSRLTLAQRYHYLVGGLGWFADPLGVGLAFFLLSTSPFLALGHPLLLRQLVGVLLVLPIFLLVAGLLRLAWSIHAACGAPWRDTPLAAMVMLALSWTVTRACVGALVTQRGVFLRTPKVRTPSRLGRAVLGTLPETLVAAACAVMAVAVGLFGPHTLGLRSQRCSSGRPLRGEVRRWPACLRRKSRSHRPEYCSNARRRPPVPGRPP